MEETRRRRYVKRLTDSMVKRILLQDDGDYFMRSEETGEVLRVKRTSEGIAVTFYNRYTKDLCFEDYDKFGRWIRRGVLV